jgi:hypothetical protein
MEKKNETVFEGKAWLISKLKMRIKPGNQKKYSTFFFNARVKIFHGQLITM